jgi:hypothetical protein
MAELLELVFVLLGDGIVKCNDPLNQFPVKKAVWVIWCWISQLSV